MMDQQLIRAIESVGEPNWTAVAQAIAAFLMVIIGIVGFILILRQLKASYDSLKAQLLLKLFGDWRDLEIYESMAYINRVRQRWKNSENGDWQQLALKWVIDHADSKGKDDELWQEWIWRRTASQFLAKMGALIQAGYLSPEEFFRVNPEVGRQLAVLTPIENAIKLRFESDEGKPIAKWDMPFPKWEFKQLQEDYEAWFSREGYALAGLDSPKETISADAKSLQAD